MCDTDRNRLEAERFNIQHVLVLRHAVRSQAWIWRFSAWSCEKCVHYFYIWSPPAYDTAFNHLLELPAGLCHGIPGEGCHQLHDLCQTLLRLELWEVRREHSGDTMGLYAKALSCWKTYWRPGNSSAVHSGLENPYWGRLKTPPC